MLRGKKSKLVMAMVLAIGLILSACGGSSSSTEGGSEGTESAAKTYRVGVVLMALNSDYWHMVEAGAINAGKELGVDITVVGPNAESDVTGQIAMVEDLLAQGVNAIVISRNDPKALMPVLKKAMDAGVPVITIDGDIADPSLRKTFIGTENVDAAKEAGNYIASILKSGDQAAIIRGLPGDPTHNNRELGCKEALEAKGIEIVAIQPADSERAKAVSVAENLLQAYPDIKAIYATNDEMALGAYQAFESAGKEIIIVGFDGSPDALKSIADDKLSATVAQMPVMEGYKGVESALKLLNGEAVEDHIKLPITIVTKDNVAEFVKNLEADLAKAKE